MGAKVRISEGALRTMILQKMREYPGTHGATFAIIRLGEPGDQQANWSLRWHDVVSPELRDSAALFLETIDVV